MINTGESILRALAYFNLFSYPLRKEEIYQFLGRPCDRVFFDKTLQDMCRDKVVYRAGEFYSLQNNNSLAERRREGNTRAAAQLKTAVKIASFLNCFPFVRGVAVSGSLSKNYADKNSDIDFFIITSGNRLWLARTLLHLYKKCTYLTGRQHWYCMNYFIDEDALEIKERNIFTATEVLTLLPLQGTAVFNKFFSANHWANRLLPHCQPKSVSSASVSTSRIKKLIEQLFPNPIGDYVDQWLMRVTIRRWNSKARARLRSASGELMALDGDRHYAKPDPANFQKKILLRYERELEALMMRLETVTGD